MLNTLHYTKANVSKVLLRNTHWSLGTGRIGEKVNCSVWRFWSLLLYVSNEKASQKYPKQRWVANRLCGRLSFPWLLQVDFTKFLLFLSCLLIHNSRFIASLALSCHLYVTVVTRNPCVGEFYRIACTRHLLRC